jgi:hypothetical protein
MAKKQKKTDPFKFKIATKSVKEMNKDFMKTVKTGSLGKKNIFNS